MSREEAGAFDLLAVDEHPWYRRNGGSGASGAGGRSIMGRIILGFAILLVSQGALGADVNLTVSEGPGPLHATLQWSGGNPPFAFYRSESLQMLTVPANQRGTTAGATWTDGTPPLPIEYYSVLEANRTVFFSEYVEGTSFNKALEIFSPFDTSFDLTGCEIRLFLNGSMLPQPGVSLSGVSIPPGDVWVVCNPATTALSLCDQTSAGINFTGDDAVQLLCGGTTLDVIGQIGVDPGTEWGTDPESTQDQTLRRKCSFYFAGDINGTDAFSPSVEWVG
jgi:hypothetical protein